MWQGSEFQLSMLCLDQVSQGGSLQGMEGTAHTDPGSDDWVCSLTMKPKVRKQHCLSLPHTCIPST